ncbi:MAG: hypothetical protein JOY71_01535 [Acetobacteraceae bacterium]|nr:hypothetical protein [Acetobacteraceae bacterium]
MPFDGTDSRVAHTQAVINGLIAHYDISHREPGALFITPNLRADLCDIRAKLGIRGDNARECILRGFGGKMWRDCTLSAVNFTVRTASALENLLNRALDYASGVTMREPNNALVKSYACMCTPPRSAFLTPRRGS